MSLDVPPSSGEIRELSISEIGLLLMRINQLSQGEKTLVEELLSIVAEEQPHWRIPQMRLDQLVDALKARFIAIVGTPSLHRSGIDPTSVELELESQIVHMDVVFNERGEAHDDPDEHRAALEQSLCSIVRREYHYLVINKGRPRFGPQRNGVMFDPHASYILHYLMRGTPTGNIALDNVCKTMGAMLATRKGWIDVGGYNLAMEQLAEIKRAYHVHHLDDPWEAPHISPLSAPADAEAM